MRRQVSVEKRNFGVLTDVSKGWNMILGDKSGRTVSRRTAHGFKNSLGLSKMDTDTAEDIVHFGMIISALLLFTKDRRAVTFGVILVLILVFFYQMGKSNPVSLVRLN